MSFSDISKYDFESAKRSRLARSYDSIASVYESVVGAPMAHSTRVEVLLGTNAGVLRKAAQAALESDPDGELRIDAWSRECSRIRQQERVRSRVSPPLRTSRIDWGRLPNSCGACDRPLGACTC